MPKFIYLPCRCGRTLRAWDRQIGSFIRCWGCREEAVVPHPNRGGQLAAEMWALARDAMTRERAVSCLAGAVLATAALLSGVGGLVAAVTLLAVAAFLLRGALVRTAGRGWTGVRRHPIAVLGVVLALPTGLVATEAALVGVAYEQDWLRYLALDVSPRAGAVAVLGDRPDVGGIDLPLISDAEVFRLYGAGLRRGHALTWAVPASLTRGMATRSDSGYAFANAVTWHDHVNPVNYLGFRTFVTVAALSCVLAVLAVAAGWVDLIGTFEARLLSRAVADQGRSARAGQGLWHGGWALEAVQAGEVPGSWAGTPGAAVLAGRPAWAALEGVGAGFAARSISLPATAGGAPVAGDP